MNLLESVILGLIQGLTEFLPISSSGHLVIAESLFGVETGDIVFEVLVHFGTLLAVLIYFRKRLFSIAKSTVYYISGRREKAEISELRMVLFILIGTIPAVVVGLAFKDIIVTAFDSPRMASVMLLVTAAILFSTRWAGSRSKDIEPKSSLFIGLAQAMAIMPGISRSGSTISAGMLLGVDKSIAAEFSFLLSIPAIAGATILEIPEFMRGISDSSLMPGYIMGAATAAISGYISIAYLLSIIKKGKFSYFGLYCLIVGILGIILL